MESAHPGRPFSIWTYHLMTIEIFRLLGAASTLSIYGKRSPKIS
ncbi:Hypothetical protein (plasmid) [Pseudomonas putida]|nr:Hypothetical protein [Pseudomonas putida]